MNTNTFSATPNFESVWAILQETAQRQKENERFLTEKFAETDRQRKENERFLTEKFAETARLFKETREEMKETDRRMKETDRLFKETREEMKETDRRMKETDRKMEETDRRMKNLQNELGNIGRNQGSFAEEYFFNSFEKGKQNFFGERFDKIKKNLTHFWQGLEDEYDIVMYNHASVAIIEVKYKAHVKNIPNVLKKAETFRILFPNYKDFKIYLGLASMSFYPELERECIEKGIVVIKQVGDTVVIHDEYLKVF